MSSSHALLENLTKGAVAAIRYLHETSPLEDTLAFQLFFDATSCEWVYLFVPSSEGFGHHINRYVDLRNQEVRQVSSQSEFLRLFQPASEDELKFLVSPFRDYSEISGKAQVCKVYTLPNNSTAADLPELLE
jgi:hypothetical protein